MVIISVDGEEISRCALSEEHTVPIRQGEHSNTLVISGGHAWIQDATCPDKLCEKQGRIHLQGQMIVCLPNRVVITIEGGEAFPADIAIG